MIDHVSLLAPLRYVPPFVDSSAYRADEGEPDLRSDDHVASYAAFLFGPDGNDLEAFTHSPE